MTTQKSVGASTGLDGALIERFDRDRWACGFGPELALFCFTSHLQRSGLSIKARGENPTHDRSDDVCAAQAEEKEEDADEED